MLRLAYLGLLSCALLGCAQNAILELQLQLPPAPTGEVWYAQAQLRRSDDTADFALAWMGDDMPGVVLTDQPQWDCLSLQTLGTGASLILRVRFCRSPTCLDLADGDPPERLYRIERPFHSQATTYLKLRIPQFPQCALNSDCDAGVCVDGQCVCSSDVECGEGFECLPTVGCVRLIGRCEIEGCIEGPLSSEFCSIDGEHFCDRNPRARRDSTWACY